MSAAPLRVLQVAAPTRTGGLESVLVQLAGGLHQRGHSVEVALVLVPGSEVDHPVVGALKQTGVPVHVLLLGVRDYIGERRAVRQLAQHMAAQVVHTHGYRADAVDAGPARSAGARHVMTLHGFVGGSTRGRFYEWLQIQAAKRANAVVAVSQPIVQRLEGHGITRNVHLVQNAVAPSSKALSRDEARRALGLPLEGTQVGWVGRVSHEKGPDIFVQALASRSWSIAAAIVGDGPLLADIRASYQREHADAKLFTPGLVPQASRYLAAFDVLALTSRTEGTPMILLEAMWAGVPIVATKVGGVPNVLSDSDAMLCDPTVDAVGDALQEALSDMPAMLQRARNARDRVQRDFSPESWLDTHERIYRQAIAR